MRIDIKRFRKVAIYLEEEDIAAIKTIIALADLQLTQLIRENALTDSEVQISALPPVKIGELNLILQKIKEL